jgi:hypothetical protein
VGEALVRRVGTDGQCDPSHATLAQDAACEPRTVQRATDAMRDLGLIRWQRRLVRAGWRTEQTTNAYELVPTLAAAPVLPRAACGGHSVRETRRRGSGLKPSEFLEVFRINSIGKKGLASGLSAAGPGPAAAYVSGRC